MTKLLSIALISSIVFIGCAQKPEERQIVKKDKALSIQLEATSYAHQVRSISSISGKVKTIHINTGDKIEEGNDIFSIDENLILREIKVLEKQIADAKDNIRYYQRANRLGNNPSIIQLARMNLEKVASLYSKGYTSEEDFNLAKVNYANAIYSESEKKNGNNTNYINQKKDLSEKELKLFTLQERLKNTTVKANMSGYLHNLELFEGKLLTEGEKVGEIIDISKIKVRAGLATGLLPFVKKGREAKITFLTTPPFELSVPIKKIIPVMDAEFGRVTVDFEVDNTDYLIQPGTKAIVTVALKENEQDKVKEMFLFDEKKNKSNVIEVTGGN